MVFTRTQKIIAGILGGVALIAGILWYFQQQGFLKVLPSAQDRRMKKILEIDESVFASATGLEAEIYRRKIAELYALRGKVEQNPKDAQAWFNFAYAKDFLNDHEGAVAAWKESFRLQPLNFVTAFNIGNNYQYFLKDYAQAEFYYKKTLEIQKAYTSAYQGLADLYRFNWKDKQVELEPLMLTAARADTPNQDKYYAILAEFFASTGDIAKARDYLSRVRALNPELAREIVENYPALQ